jgi:RNA polymerase sigma-70 factor (ECF subfamily)
VSGDFAAVFDLHFAEIHRYVAGRLGTSASADDIAAETFLTAYTNWGRYDAAAGTVRAWLYGIATKKISRHRRDEVRAYRAMQRITADTVPGDPSDQTTDRVMARGLQRQLAAALAELPQRERDVLLLVALADLSHAEIAAALGIPYGTVGSRLSRARQKLRSALASHDPSGRTSDSQDEDDNHG